MVERERTVINSGGGGGGGATIAVILLIIAVAVVLFLVFGRGLLSGGETTKIDADVNIDAPATSTPTGQ
jgi:uncharacterized membrane protein